MALSAQDKGEIRDIVRLGIQDTLLDEEHGIPAMIARFINAHQQACPHGQALRQTKWIVIGLAIGSFLAGGGSVLAVLRPLW